MDVESTVRVRERNESDRMRLFRWRNRPEVVALGASQRQVSWEEHCAWFERVSDGSRHWLRVVEVDGVAVGSVRLDRSGDAAEIAVYLEPTATGQGHGVQVIRLACDAAVRCWPGLQFVRAAIRADNRASRIAFERAGFRWARADGALSEVIWDAAIGSVAQ